MSTRSLSEKAEPYWNVLHRYAVAISDRRDSSNFLVKRTMANLASHPQTVKGEGPAKVELFRAFHETIRQVIASSESPLAEKQNARDLLEWDAQVRQAVLLNNVENFTVDEVAYILGLDRSSVQVMFVNRSNYATKSIRVLLVAPLHESRRLSELVSAMGFRVLGPYTRHTFAVQGGSNKRANLVIADVRSLASTQEILNTYSAPCVFISDRQVIGDGLRPVITVRASYTLDEMQAAIANALYYPVEEIDDSSVSEALAGDMTLNSDQFDSATVPEPAPVDARVENGLLHLAEQPRATARLNLEDLESLKRDHLADVTRLISTVSNLGPSFSARFESLKSLLGEPLTESSALRIANQSSALERMAPAADESLGAESAADVKSIIVALLQFSKQFDVWTKFHQDALAQPRLSESDQMALKSVAKVIESQSSSIVSSDLKTAIADTVENASVDDSADSQLALIRSISNSLKAVGRYIKERAKGAGKSFTESLDKQIGEGLAGGLVNIFIMASTPLLALMANLPAHFAWLGPIFAAIRTFRPAK